MFDSTKLRGFINQVTGPVSSFGYKKGTSEETTGFAQFDNDYPSPEYTAGSVEQRVTRQPRSTSAGSIRSVASEGPDIGDEPIGYQQRRKPERFDGVADAAVPEEDEEGDAEGGGKTQISHWQAGWNVTNAIQVTFADDNPWVQV